MFTSAAIATIRSAIVTASLLPMSMTVCAQADVRLRPAVQIHSAHILLNDIAELSAPDVATLRRLMQLSLGRAPRPGASVRVARHDIERLLRSHVHGTVVAVAVSGPDDIEITTSSQPVAGERISHTARQALEKWLETRVEQYGVTVTAEPRDVDLPRGAVSLLARPLQSSMAVSRRMLVWVDVMVDQQFHRAIPVRFEVNALRSAWVASESTSAGESLTGANVVRRHVDATTTGNGRWNGPAEDGAVRLRHRVSNGEAISQRDIEPVPEVSRGGWAMLRAGSGAVALESRVAVLQDGRRGQSVKVRAPFSASPLTALVTGPGQVEILEK